MENEMKNLVTSLTRRVVSISIELLDSRFSYDIPPGRPTEKDLVDVLERVVRICPRLVDADRDAAIIELRRRCSGR